MAGYEAGVEAYNVGSREYDAGFDAYNVGSREYNVGSREYNVGFDAWTDPDHARTWLCALREAADDLAALAREGGRRLAHRVLSRAELRRQTRAAERSVHGLLAEAERSRRR